MKYHTLTIEKTDRVALISIIGPWNDQDRLAVLSQELDQVCRNITWDEDIAVVLITGTGEQPFCILNQAGAERWPLADRLAALDTPVIAAAQGDVLGQGLEMLLACDIRLCSTSARFGLPQIKNGLMPADGGTQRLSRIIGCAKAMELILTGETTDAQTALELGLVSRMEPAHSLAGAAMELAKNVSLQAPIALRYGKEAINKGMDLTMEQGLRLEADLYFLLHTTHDRTEGITAFRQKKNPVFRGE
jgi:enoyl-CoA hydratase/carnithine racemase